MDRYNDWLLPLLRQFLFISNRNNKFIAVCKKNSCMQQLCKDIKVVKWWCLFGFLQCVVAKHFGVLKEHTASIFRMTELVSLDVKVIQSKKCLCYTGRFEGDWPVMGVEGRKWGYNCTEPMRVQFCKTGPFFMGRAYGICVQNVHCDCDMISAQCSLTTCRDQMAFTSTLFQHIVVVVQPTKWAVPGNLNFHWIRTLLSPLPAFCTCERPNFLKLFCVKETFVALYHFSFYLN